MPHLFAKTALVLALSAAAIVANAQDAPGRVGRVALAQGQVMINTPDGEQASGGLVNWPVTARTQLTTERNARTEFSVGSSLVRLDGDSSMEVVELDDERMVLRLHYGSASVRLRTAEAAKGFELSTPQGRVRLEGPGRIRVDADRTPDTLVLNVFEGAATVDGGGAQLLVRAGKRAEVHLDDVRTGLAVRDGFDDWAALRDQQSDRAVSRYVPVEMTGYEELSYHGSWSNNSEYGPIWAPRNVPVNWAPYRDGRWAWIAPFGWTWVDNSPWGYAPFHYGRWVMVGSRWCWAPGRLAARPVWAPALVGWVGGNGWNVTFNLNGGRRYGPGLGWYPLSPFDHFVPHYRMRHDHYGYFRSHLPHHRDRDRDHHRRRGLTVVPHDHFGNRGTVVVTNAPRAVVPTVALTTAPNATPPRPQFDGRRPDWRHRDDNRPRDARDNRDNRDGRDQRDYRDGRDQRGQQPAVAPTATPPQPVVVTPPQPPVVAPVPQVQPERRPERGNGRDRRDDNEPPALRPGEGIDYRRPVTRPAPQVQQPQLQAPAVAPPPQPMQVMPMPTRMPPPQRQPLNERPVEQRAAPPAQQVAPMPPQQRSEPPAPPPQRIAPPPPAMRAEPPAPPPQRVAPPPPSVRAEPPPQAEPRPRGRNKEDSDNVKEK